MADKNITTDFFCLVCQQKVAQFGLYGEPARPGQCPHCKSKPRNRAMAYFLKNWAAPSWTPSTQILEIGASKVQTSYIIDPHFIGPAQYSVVDIRRLNHHDRLQSPYGFQQMDASNMTWPDHSFDHIFCNYVLQDAPDPFAVVKEIKRCLKPGGWGTLNVAFISASTRPVDSIPQTDRVTVNAQDYYDSNGRCYQFGKDFQNSLKDLGLFSDLIQPFRDFPKTWLDRHFIRPTEDFLLIAHNKESLQSLIQAMQAGF